VELLPPDGQRWTPTHCAARHRSLTTWGSGRLPVALTDSPRSRAGSERRGAHGLRRRMRSETEKAAWSGGGREEGRRSPSTTRGGRRRRLSTQWSSPSMPPGRSSAAGSASSSTSPRRGHSRTSTPYRSSMPHHPPAVGPAPPRLPLLQRRPPVVDG
jgi:hypothetical protein